MALELFAGRFSVGVTGSRALGPLPASRAVSGKLHRTEGQRNSKEGSRRSMTLWPEASPGPDPTLRTTAP